MSTIFVVKKGELEVKVARRIGTGEGRVETVWLASLAHWLNDYELVYPIDNSAQGMKTIGDLRGVEPKPKLFNCCDNKE